MELVTQTVTVLQQWLEQIGLAVTSTTDLVQKLTALVVAIAALWSAVLSLRGKSTSKPTKAEMASGKSEPPSAREALEEQVGYGDLLAAATRQRRQIRRSRLAGHWLLPLAVVVGAIFEVAALYNLTVEAPTAFAAGHINALIGLAIALCWLIERLLTPDRWKQLSDWTRLVATWGLAAAVGLATLYLGGVLFAPLQQGIVTWQQTHLSAVVGLMLSLCWLVERNVVPTWRAQRAAKRLTDLEKSVSTIDLQIDARVKDSIHAWTTAQIIEASEKALARVARAEARD